jgi:plasmid stabilization system protein ParE
MPAAEELERICDRIEGDNPEAARRVARAIYDGCGRLKDFPHLGRASIRMAGRRCAGLAIATGAIASQNWR